MKDLSFVNALPADERQKILEGPAMKPPMGVESNFDHPQNKNALGYGYFIATSVLCTAFVLLRLYSRYIYQKVLSIEDALIVAALALFGGYMFCAWSILRFPGIYAHQWDVRIKDLPRILYIFNVASIFFRATICLLKCSILLDWSRIFVPRGVRNTFWWTCWFTCGINVVFYVICIFLAIFPCNPRQKHWNLTLPGKCTNVALTTIVSAGVNLCIDVLILILPQRIIWGLQMSLQKKLGVAIIFAAGIFACISAAVRMSKCVRFAHGPDALYTGVDQGLWSIAEMVSCFLVACLPSVPKLLTDSPWVRAFTTMIKYRLQTSTKRTTNEAAKVPTIGQWRTPRRSPRGLLSDLDHCDLHPLTNINVTTSFKVEVEPIDSKNGTGNKL